MNTIHRIDNQVSIVMRPASGEVWATPGPLAKDKADSYCRLNLKELFASEVPLTDQVHDRRTVAYGLDAAPALPESEAQPDEGGRVMSRYVLRVADVSLNDRSERTPNFHGPVLIMGQNPTALALRERLEESGATVRDLPVCDDPEETLAALDRFWQAHPTPHLFLMTARDDDAAPGDDEEAWARRRARGVMLPYLVCQRWTRLVSQSHLLEKATLVAATAMGGDFGFSGRATAVEGGALTGLLKSIRREFERMLVKVVDTPPEESPRQVVAGLWAELAAGTPEVEVGYVRGRRRLVRAVPRSPEPLEQRDIPRGGTWVVTGGARGITGFVARELGRRFGLELHLIGTTPPPQTDAVWRNLSADSLRDLKMTITKEARRTGRDPLAAWRQVERAIELDKTLRAFAEEGVRATYHDCDVSDRKALGRVLESIRQSAGPIHGIIHGAGVEAAARFDRKQLDSVTATIAAKVDGAAVLMALTREDPLAYFVGFGSISGRFGGHGQTDYSLASDMLGKLIGRFRTERPTCASVAIHWPAWGELGMAVRPESKVVLALAQRRFMPPLEGVEHLIDELRAGAPEAEVLFIDQPGRLDLDKTTPTPIQLQAYRQRSELISKAPLIDGVYELHEGHSLVAEARFDPTRDRFLVEHRHQGVPILPAVVGIELLAEAASILSPGRTVVGLRNLDVINGFRFFSDRPQGARIRATLVENGIQCELRADFYNREGRLTDPDRVYLKGLVELADGPTAITLPHPGEPGNWKAMKYLDPHQAIQEGRIYLGPPLQCLRNVAFERGGCWGRIVAPPFTELAGVRRGDGWVVPSAVLDGCLQTAGAFMYKEYGTVQLPRAAERLRVGRLPRDGETCIVRLTMRDRQTTHTDFDFALFGEDGTVILSAEAYRCIVVSRKAS
jgi:NAD(P)-dependent dehydrogenase (short-subunit alcohol dehydrogenase family)